MTQAAAIITPARRGVRRARYVSGRVTEKYLKGKTNEKFDKIRVQNTNNSNGLSIHGRDHKVSNPS